MGLAVVCYAVDIGGDVGDAAGDAVVAGAGVVASAVAASDSGQR